MDNADAHNGTYAPRGHRHFTLTPAIHEALARWNGNAAATYRELVTDGTFGHPPRVSQATFYRAVKLPESTYDRDTLRQLAGGTMDPVT